MAGSSGGGMEDWPVFGIDGYAAMVEFVEIGQSCIPASMLESWPAQSQQHVVYARCSAISLLGPSCCLSLDRFKAFDQPGVVRIPDRASILEYRSDESLVGPSFH